MRPIDADTLIADINEWLECVGTALIGRGLSCTWELFGRIHDAPTLTLEDLRPTAINLKAEWPSLFKCSACGWDDGDTFTGDTDTYNYCPNCGAKMGGGK